MSVTPGACHATILLVDGDSRSSQRLASLLREDGYDVEVARNAAAAIVHLGQGRLPNILITELVIPLGDGPALARYACSRASGLRVIVLTRYANLLVPSAFGSQPPTVLTKPLDYARLLEVLRGQAPSGEKGATVTSPAI